MQLCMPLSSWKEPGLQSEQSELPVPVLLVPGGHGEQASCSSESVYLPASQAVHWVA